MSRIRVPVNTLSIACTLIAVATGCNADELGDSLDHSLADQPVFRMPFERGEVVYCQQGNESPAGYSHSYDNTRYGIDFSNDSKAELNVVAAADGVVTQIVTGAGPGDIDPGLGFGNFVKVAHPGAYFTMYSHLDQVLVVEGQSLRSGELLGTMGDTGNAGNRHLHFSLHRQDPPASGAGESFPFAALYAKDVDGGDSFQSIDSRDLVCDLALLSGAGHVYGSDNSPEFALGDGVDSPDLVARLAANARAFHGAVTARLRVYEIMNQLESRGAEWAAGQLAELVAEFPGSWEGRYYLGVLLARDLADPAGGYAQFTAILEEYYAEGGVTPAWLAPWSHARAAEIAKNWYAFDLARELIDGALSFAEDGSGIAQYAQAVEHALDSIVETHRILGLWPTEGSAWAADQLAAVVADLPSNWEARYYLGLVLLRELSRPEDGAVQFTAVLDAYDGGVNITPTWAVPWSHVRMAMVAIALGQTGLARDHLDAALTFPEDGTGLREFALQLLAGLD